LSDGGIMCIHFIWLWRVANVQIAPSMISRQYKKLLGILLAAAFMQIAATAVAVAETYEDALLAYNKGDFATALRLYRSLAERGNASAQQGLARMYLRGEGVQQDPSEASKWFHKASELINGLAAYNHGDFDNAMRIFHPLADEGQVLGEYIIGLMYANGQGVPENYPEALKWLQKAAEQGEAKAQFSVGAIYFKGLGIPRDYAEASKWYDRAAKQGSAIAQFNLGLMYGKGQGVPQNSVTAYMLLSLAAAKGVKPAGEAKDKLAKSMDSAQIAEAEKLAHEWKPKPEL